MTCRYLEIKSDWFVRAAEDALITNYNPECNASGFGSHTPGRGGPGIRVSSFDTSFPPRPGTDPEEVATVTSRPSSLCRVAEPADNYELTLSISRALLHSKLSKSAGRRP